MPIGMLTAALLVIKPLSPAFALGPNDPLYKNNLGMYTAKCQVHRNTSGNLVEGFVVGNHQSDPEKAEKEANNFTSRFGNGHAKRHCATTKQ